VGNLSSISYNYAMAQRLVRLLLALNLEALALTPQYAASAGDVKPHYGTVYDKTAVLPDAPSPLTDEVNAVYLSNPHLQSQQDDIFMRYMPEQGVVVCGCGKCGSTSMLEYIWDSVFAPKSWTKTWSGKGSPYVQEVLSPRWEGQFEMVPNHAKQDWIMSTAYSFALIRDPMERLVSAWKSKVACENEYGVDQYDRAHFDPVKGQFVGFVQHIQALSGGNTNATCLTLLQYSQALLRIKKMNRMKYLDRHFLAQDLGCFARHAPEHWSEVRTIDDADAFSDLAGHLHNKKNQKASETHSSKLLKYIMPEVYTMLKDVTKDEYKTLAPYLKSPSRVKMGTVALETSKLGGQAVMPEYVEVSETEEN